MAREMQLKFMGRDREDYEYVPIQFKVPMERKRDLIMYVRQRGFRTITNFLNLMIIQVLENEKQMHDPKTLRPLHQAIKDLDLNMEAIRKYSNYGYRQVDEIGRI